MQQFFEDVITLIAPSHHPWAANPTIQPSALIGEPFILRESTSGTRRIVLSELAKHDISLDDLNIFMELGNAEAIVRTVAAGYGISFVSTMACLFAQSNIVIVNIEDIALRRKIYMVRKRPKRLRPGAPSKIALGYSTCRTPTSARTWRRLSPVRSSICGLSNLPPNAVGRVRHGAARACTVRR